MATPCAVRARPKEGEGAHLRGRWAIMARMESRVDYAARPDFGAHVVGLGEAKLRGLLRVACPGASVPPSRSETVEMLTTREAAQAAVSAATPDVLAAVKLVHVLEDKAAIADIAAVAVWGSEADAMPHDGDQPPSSVRAPATRSEVADLLSRAEDLGLAWQEPEGVWNVPPHVSDVLVQDATMATPVECLLEFTPPDVLSRRMRHLGLLGDGEEDVAAGELLVRLRTFFCSPRRVRALVSTAPHAIQKELLLFAREGIFLEESAWGARRAAAVDWAVEHLLCVTFEVPASFDGVSAEDGAPLAHHEARSADDDEPLLRDGAVPVGGDATSTADEPVAAPDVNASLLSPVALALKLGRQWIPTQHPEEQRPAWIEAEAPGRAATAAVAVATAVMERWEDGGYLGTGNLHDFAGAVAVHDFAASIGAEDSVVHEVVGMLAGAGFMNPLSGQPTARSAGTWFGADASRRWAWLVAGWLRGPDRWVGEESPEGWMPSPELMAHVAGRIRREAVQLASELDEGMMWYPCCIESRLAWRCGALFDGLEDMWGMLLGRVLQGMRVLGLMVDGAAGQPVRVVADAMVAAWFSGQEPGVDEAVEMIAAEAGQFIPVAARAQLLTPPSLLVADRVELVAMARGVPRHELAVTLDSVADREKCGATSLWIFTEDSLADALEDYAGDIPAILEDVGSVTEAGPWLRILRHRLHALEEAADLGALLPADPPAGPDAAAPASMSAEDGGTEEWDMADGADGDRVVEQELDLGLDIAPDHQPVYADGDDAVAEDTADDGRAPDDSSETPLFDVVGLFLEPTAAPDSADPDSAGPGERADGGGGSSSSSTKGELPTLDDPLRRPDSGTGPGVPIQPPLF